MTHTSRGAVRVRLDGWSWDGRAIDLETASLGPCDTREFVETSATTDGGTDTPYRESLAGDGNLDGSDADDGSDLEDEPVAGGSLVARERAWHVPDESATLTGSLARAARSWGHTAPQADRIETLERRLAAIDPPQEPDLEAARRQAATAGEAVERLRERAATLRGRLQARREAGLATDGVEQELAETMRELTEAETTAIAAQERLGQVRDAAQRVRDARERRLRLRDELANRRREARRVLADRLYEPFRAAVARLPGEAAPGSSPDEYTGDPVTARLGAVAVAAGDAPVVLAVDRFADAVTAARRLGAPVVRVCGDG